MHSFCFLWHGLSLCCLSFMLLLIQLLFFQDGVVTFFGAHIYQRYQPLPVMCVPGQGLTLNLSVCPACRLVQISSRSRAYDLAFLFLKDILVSCNHQAVWGEKASEPGRSVDHAPTWLLECLVLFHTLFPLLAGCYFNLSSSDRTSSDLVMLLGNKAMGTPKSFTPS